MNHSRYRGGLGGLLAAVFGGEQLTPEQESRIQAIRAREVQQIGMARGRIDGLRGQYVGLSRSLRGIQQDISAAETAASMTRDPNAKAQLQSRARQKKKEMRDTQERMNGLDKQAAVVAAELRQRLSVLRAQNRIEAQRVQSPSPREDEPTVNPIAVARAFGLNGEMSRMENVDGFETFSFNGVTFEGSNEIPTSNLTEEDIPYYMEKQDAEYAAGIDKLKTSFDVVELKRREVIELYNQTGDEALRAGIQTREARFQQMKVEVFQLREAGNKATLVAEAKTPNRPWAGYRPPKYPYPPGYVQEGHGNPPQYQTKEPAAKFPLRDSQLAQYLPKIRQLNDDANRLAIEYETMRPKVGRPRGFDEQNANDDSIYQTDKLPSTFDEFTTPAGYRPPLPGQGVLVPMHSQEQVQTLNGLSISTSGDLAKPGGRLIGYVGDGAREVFGNLTPIQVEKNVPTYKIRSARDLLDEQLRNRKVFEEAH